MPPVGGRAVTRMRDGSEAAGGFDLASDDEGGRILVGNRHRCKGRDPVARLYLIINSDGGYFAVRSSTGRVHEIEPAWAVTIRSEEVA